MQAQRTLAAVIIALPTVRTTTAPAFPNAPTPAVHALDHAVVLAYFLLTVGLGIAFGRQKSREEFFAASHSMGVLTVGLSVMATLFSSNSFVMYPSAAYGSSLRVGLTLLSVSLMAPLVIWVFIPVYARCGCRTAYEYLEQRFHVSVRCLASGLFVLLRIGWMASATFAASLVLARVSGVDQVVVILSLGVAAVVYTMLGGLRAVMWTDVVQFFVFATTIVLALGLLASKVDGGMAGMVDTYFAGREGLLVDFSPSMTLEFGSWAILIGIFLEALSAFGADQVAVQRYIAARSERTSQFAFLVNLVGMWLVIPSLLLIGVGLYGHFQQTPSELVPVLTEELAETDSERAALAEQYRETPSAVAADVRKHGLEDEALPQFVRLHFPPGVKGLFLAALMAAVMSSIDSGIHSVTTAVVVDFRDRLWPHRKPHDERNEVRLVRGLVLLIGAIAVTLACFVGPLGNVFDIGKKVTAAFGGPLLAVFVVALFSPRARTAGVFAGTLLAAAATLVLMERRPDWFSVWFWPIGFGLAVAGSLGFSAILAALRGPLESEPLTFRTVLRRNPANPASNTTNEGDP